MYEDVTDLSCVSLVTFFHVHCRNICIFFHVHCHNNCSPAAVVSVQRGLSILLNTWHCTCDMYLLQAGTDEDDTDCLSVSLVTLFHVHCHNTFYQGKLRSMHSTGIIHAGACEVCI